MPPITELQLSILRLMWTRGEVTVAEVWEALYPERHLAQTTVATLLTRLERRGVIGRRVDQRQYRYRALVSQGDVQRTMVGELTAQLFGGDAVSLVHHLLNAQEVVPGDLSRLRAIIDDAERRINGDP